MNRIFLPAFFLIISSTIAAQQKVGIGTNTPTEKLEVAGNIKADTVKPTAIKLTANAGQGKVLTSDAVGNASWNTSNNSAPNNNIGYGVWGDCATNGNISEYQPVADTSAYNFDNFGFAVALSSEFALVGSRRKKVGANIEQGSVGIFKFNGTHWELLQTLTDAAGTAGDNFGYAVAISGNYLIIGVPFAKVGANFQQGTACIYQYNGSSWIFKQRIVNAGGAAGDNFGQCVSISGEYAIVGSQYDKINANVNQGSANIYKYNGTSWVPQQYLYETTGANANDNFGCSVSISGNFAVVGISGADVSGVINQGAANVYQFNGSTWVLLQKLTDLDYAQGDYFGYAVSLSENYLVISTINDDVLGNTDQGSATIYKFTGSTLVPMQKLTAYVPGFSTTNSGSFGSAVSISENYVIVGAENDNNKYGAAYIYIRVGDGWQKLQTVTDPGGNYYDGFGNAVGIDPVTKRFLIGAAYYGDINFGKVVFGKIN